MIKLFITDYRKITFWGDCHAYEDGMYFPFEGKKLKVQLLWLFWITYRTYRYPDRNF